MSYRMFIDDERFPVEKDSDMVIVRNFNEARTHMILNGCPIYISFDHDLGEVETGYDIAKWIVEMDLNSNGKFIPKEFDFYVHSQNVCGKENIIKFLKSYLKHINA